MRKETMRVSRKCPAQGGRPARLRRCGGQPSHGRLICKQIGFPPCGVFPEECSAFFWSCFATPLAGEHNPCCSHRYRESIAHPMSLPEECSAFFESCSATPADHGASAETCDELRRGRSSSVCSAQRGDANSDRNAHYMGAIENRRNSLFYSAAVTASKDCS